MTNITYMPNVINLNISSNYNNLQSQIIINSTNPLYAEFQQKYLFIIAKNLLIMFAITWGFLFITEVIYSKTKNKNNVFFRLLVPTILFSLNSVYIYLYYFITLDKIVSKIYSITGMIFAIHILLVIFSNIDILLIFFDKLLKKISKN